MPREKSYSDLLRDPRWQKKRLEILNAAGFKCEDCGSSDKELQVHHCIYLKDRLPWDYNRNTLMAICDICHKWRQDWETESKAWMAIFLRFSSLETIYHLNALLVSIVESFPQYVKPDTFQETESTEAKNEET